MMRGLSSLLTITLAARRALVGAGPRLVLGVVLASSMGLVAEAAPVEAGGEPEPGPESAAEPGESIASEPAPEPDAAEPDATGAADEPSDSLAPSEDLEEPVSEAAEPDPGSDPAHSGRFETDDEPVDEAQREEDRRAGRRLRARERDEGQWQVFAPYPELGPIRYRDPEGRRTLWMGADVAGTYLPPSFGLADHAVWTVRPAGAWAFALTPWLAVGGRHEMAWYDADERRMRVHGHQVELSSRPLAASRSTHALDDRLAVGVTTHAVRWTDVGTADVVGVHDTIVHLGYGLDHLLGTRWRLGWQVQGRHAWVPGGTQRQARASARLAFHPRPAHRLSLDAVGYYVNRDHPSGVHSLARHAVLGQVGLGYSWVGRAGVGPWTNVRATTSFLSGEAPLYELREEALEAAYGEVLVGMLARWP